MRTNVADTDTVGGERMGLRKILQVCGTRNPDTWVGDVGPDASYCLGPQGIQPQGGPPTDGATSKTT